MTVGMAHLLVLRAVKLQDHLVEQPRAVVDELVRWKLLEWNGGHGKAEDGRWVRLRAGAIILTVAGQAALQLYDLGRSQLEADPR